ncbi:MAG: chemotaxis protein MotB [Litoreibacter sp.]|nr:chemotaxis protein MotB [Litoreibacter sp.]
MSDDSNRPIIIKKKKVSGGDGHHGGAWKVAYADFVTAMMAFFMLMWLLNATTEKQRKGLADYFSPTIAIARVSGGGDGAFGGDSLAAAETLANTGRGGVLELPALEISTDAPEAAEVGADGGADQDALDEVLQGLVGKGGDSLVEELALKHITAKMTDEGLVIEITDLEGSPLFDETENQPTEVLKVISQILVESFELVTNRVSISAHSSAFPGVLRTKPAWQITTDRAQATRILLEEVGLEEARVARVVGFGQTETSPSDPMAVENNRIEVTLLRNPPKK